MGGAEASPGASRPGSNVVSSKLRLVLLELGQKSFNDAARSRSAVSLGQIVQMAVVRRFQAKMQGCRNTRPLSSHQSRR